MTNESIIELIRKGDYGAGAKKIEENALIPQNEDKKKMPETSCYEKDGQLYEQIHEGTESMFITLNGNEPKTLKDIDDHAPIKSDAITKGVVLLPDGIEDYGDIGKLVENIRTHMRKYLDINKDHEIFACYYILLSWLYDKTTTLNYMRALGDWGSGKSRYLDVIGRLCYKPILVFGALTPAVVYRLLDLWKGTLVLDEADFRKSDEQADIMKILNAGFELSRSSVARCNTIDPAKIDVFRVYGPKVIASRKSWYDKALETRCITEKMMQTERKDIIPVLDDGYYAAEVLLRRKLLKFRFDYYKKIEYKYHDLGIPELEPRLKQAVSSFTVLLENMPELLDKFKKFILSYNEKLIEDRAESLEGMVVYAMVDFIENDVFIMTASQITEKINELNKTDYKNRSVGRVIKSLGFENVQQKIDGKNMKIIKMVPKTLKTVFERYVPKAERKGFEKVTKVTKVTIPLGGSLISLLNTKTLPSTLPPVTVVTNDTVVTQIDTKLEKWRDNPDGNKPQPAGLLKNIYGFTTTELEKLKERGQIFETTPGKYQIVR